MSLKLTITGMYHARRIVCVGAPRTIRRLARFQAALISPW
jgi:hypothetical protein